MKICIVYGDDWEGLYIDGILHIQAHTITVHHLASALHVKLTTKAADQEWLEWLGRFPIELSEVKSL